MYDELKAALEATGIPIAEGDWDRAPQSGSYMTVRPEFEASALWADGRQREQAIAGSVHLFLRTNDKSPVRLIQSTLDGCGISWKLDAVQHEPRNHIVHYTWTWELEAM